MNRKQQSKFLLTRDSNYFKLLQSVGFKRRALYDSDVEAAAAEAAAAGGSQNTLNTEHENVGSPPAGFKRYRKRYPMQRLWLKISIDGSIKSMTAARHHVIKDLSLNHRDLRFLDTITTTPMAFIHAREKAIVLSIESIKMIVAHEYVLILKEQFPTTNMTLSVASAEKVLDVFIQNLRHKLLHNYPDVQSASVDASRVEIERSNGLSDDESSLLSKVEDVLIEGTTEDKRVNRKGIIVEKSNFGAHRPSRNFDDQDDCSEADGDELDFEFTVLDCALDAICTHYETAALELRVDLLPALERLTTTINSANLEDVKILKSRASRLIQRVNKIREELTRFLDDDSDMRELYLTRKLNVAAFYQDEVEHSPEFEPQSWQMPAQILIGTPNSGPAQSVQGPDRSGKINLSKDDDSDVVEAENLLEHHFMRMDTTAALLAVLDEHVDDTEDYINIELDFKRNELIQLELLLTTGTLALAIYGVVAGIFGMNMNSLPRHASFSIVISTTFAVCVLFFLLVLMYCWKRRLLFR